MPAAKLPDNEQVRLLALKRLKVLDTAAEAQFDALVLAASVVCGVPISLVSLVDENRQWFKANVGLEGFSETPRDLAFCAHAILDDNILLVEDATQDPRFSDNPLVLGDPNIRFYAGVPLSLNTGEKIGTLCVIDSKPHHLSDHQRKVLQGLATAASYAMESYRLREIERAQLTAEAALLEAADYTASIFKNTKDPIIALMLDGTVTHWNAAAEKLFGYSQDEMLGENISLLVPTELAHEDTQRLSTIADAPDGLTYQTQRLSKSGELIDVAVSLSALYNGAGRLIGATKIVHDIREEVRVKNLLAASEAKYRKLYNATPVMMQTIDAQGCLTSVNDYWLEKHGYSREEVLGRHTSEFHTPESAQYARDVVIPMVWKTGVCEEIAYQRVKKNGEVFDVLLSAYLERDAAGNPLRSMAVLVDVTVENIAKRATEELLSVIRTQFIYSVTDTNGTILEVNDAFCTISQYTREELVGANHRLINSGFHHPSFFKEIWQTIQTGRNWHGEICNRAKNGSLYWVNTVISPLHNVSGEIDRYISIRTDITERKLAEVALKQERQHLASVIEGTQAGTWQWNVATGEVHFNEYWAGILGYTLQELDNLSGSRVETWASLVHPDDTALANLELQRHFKQESGHYEAEFRMRHKDDHWVWILARGRVFSWLNERQPEWMYGTHLDISALKSEQEAAKSANERVAIATQSGGIGIWSYDVINDVLECDKTINALYGLAQHEVLTQSRCIAMVHPEDRHDAELAFQEAIADERDYDIEFRVVWQDGSLHYLRAKASLTRDKYGKALYMLGTEWDVTPLRELSNALAKEHETLRVTLQSIGDAVITTDPKGRVTWLNPVAERMTGWLTSEAKEKPLAQVFNIISEVTRKVADNPVKECLKQGRVVGLANHTILISRDGVEYGIEDSASPIRSEDGNIIGAVLVFHDVTEQRRLSNEMSYRATHDPLTGLINRAEFEVRLTRALNLAKAEACSHALMFIDLDQFKLVNDACGHTAGDILLQQVSKIFSDIVRARDTIARLGGDEFAVLLEHCTPAQAQRVAQTICDRMDEYRFIHDSKRFRIGTSIGLALMDGRWVSITHAMQAADAACYTAKAAGRNRVHTWFDTDASMRVHQGEMQWATRLEIAMDENQFELYAQRIIAVDKCNITEEAPAIHAEILLRLRGPNGEIIAPGVFLPAAERFHLASRIDRWVLSHVIAWLETITDIRVVNTLSVNLSGQSIGDKAFHAHVLTQLKAADKHVCERICLEITETVMITNMMDASIFIEQVRELGVRIALDDFGAGASSFGYLKTLNIDVLKIDGQFIKGMIQDPLDESAVRCFVDVARIAGLKTVAEYVESTEILNHVHNLGIDYAQGYLINQPAPLNLILADAGNHSAETV